MFVQILIVLLEFRNLFFEKRKISIMKFSSTINSSLSRISWNFACNMSATIPMLLTPHLCPFTVQLDRVCVLPENKQTGTTIDKYKIENSQNATAISRELSYINIHVCRMLSVFPMPLQSFIQEFEVGTSIPKDDHQSHRYSILSCALLFFCMKK